MSGEPQVLLDVSDGVATLTLNRPKSRNATSTVLLSEFRDALNELQNAPRSRVVLLRGAGPVFCAGADTKEFARIEDRRAQGLATQKRSRLMEDVVRGLGALEQPTIAAVQGGAIGGGWVFALMCDLCWTTPETVFRMPEIEIGLPLIPAGGKRLAQVVGPQRASEIVLSAEPYSSEVLQSYGAVSRIVPAEKLEEDALEFARTLATRDRRAAAMARHSIWSAGDRREMIRSDLLMIEE